MQEVVDRDRDVAAAVERDAVDRHRSPWVHRRGESAVSDEARAVARRVSAVLTAPAVAHGVTPDGASLYGSSLRLQADSDSWLDREVRTSGPDS